MKNGSDTPLFDTPLDRVLRALSFDDGGRLREYSNEPARGTEELEAQVDGYLSTLEEKQEEHEFLDIELARKVAAQCKALLRGVDEEYHQLLQAGIRYFIEENDAEADMESPIGFDDDAEVIALIAKEMGREDVLTMKGEQS